MITVKQLSKVYGKGEGLFTALQNIDFTIPTGSTVAIIGKSGSGKSTLMHIISGLDHPTAGQVLIDSTDLYAMRPREIDEFRATQMSFIFQAFFVEANQTAFQNVALPLEISGVALRERKKLVAEALDAVGLLDKSMVLAGNLSGGQKQRLAVARAIVNKPTILFADEPTGNLDSATGESIMALLFELNRTLGCTLVLVTHDNDLARRCQQQITIKDGQVSSIKSTSDRRAK
ncbi:MAG: ABC transporter ATP-binding protein [Patescibacteria group bacterium]|nr:ABC transporter ATP-binding protein [Patescibacteria group bacterium]